MTDWQPIKTAPKDGTPILLWWDSCTIPAIGRWRFDVDFGTSHRRQTVAEGWQCEDDDCIPRNQDDCTHWMPLPASPSVVASKEPL